MNKYLLYISTIICMVFTGCKNDDPSLHRLNMMRATVNGEDLGFFIRRNASGSTYILSGTQYDDAINLSISNPPMQTTYKLGNRSEHIYYAEYVSGNRVYAARTENPGTITVTELMLDGRVVMHLTAEFSFVAYSGQDSVVVNNGFVEF